VQEGSAPNEPKKDFRNFGEMRALDPISAALAAQGHVCDACQRSPASMHQPYWTMATS
jgi:hypothetical protein